MKEKKTKTKSQETEESSGAAQTRNIWFQFMKTWLFLTKFLLSGYSSGAVIVWGSFIA